MRRVTVLQLGLTAGTFFNRLVQSFVSPSLSLSCFQRFVRAVNQVKSDKDKLRKKSKSFDVFAIVHYNLLLHDKRPERWKAR